ncbi:MAG: hypothetical protein AMXMBFR44_6430 [Candidatus Campbellbacteria bacterium]
MRMNIKRFQREVLSYYKKHGRHALPWRKTRDPYRILVSEVMLQQTQVDRVIPKYKEFLKRFPTFKALAHAKTADVIRAWQGLGYNRRALALQRASQVVMREHDGKLPRDYDALIALPSVGPYTAGALLTFIWNEPMVFIETNIRTVFLHHFFPKKKNVSDKVLENIIAGTLDERRPREWYWALMDYGAHLKKKIGNESVRSRHYTKQSTFKGSNRELRGNILRTLSKNSATLTVLAKTAKRSISETRAALEALQKEGFIKRKGRTRFELDAT